MNFGFRKGGGTPLPITSKRRVLTLPIIKRCFYLLSFHNSCNKVVKMPLQAGKAKMKKQIERELLTYDKTADKTKN